MAGNAANSAVNPFVIFFGNGNSAVNLGERREADGLTGGLGSAGPEAGGAWGGGVLVGAGRELNAAAGRP